MNKSLKKPQASLSKRELRALERWEQIRTKGKVRFIFQSALTFGLTIVGVIDVTDHLFGSGHYTISAFDLLYLLMGILTGFDTWNTMESSYKNALIDARVAASPSGTLPPHDSPLQITVDSESR